jgi:hypothetical protein
MWRVVRHVCEHFGIFGFRAQIRICSGFRIRNPDFLVEIRKFCTAARGVWVTGVELRFSDARVELKT